MVICGWTEVTPGHISSHISTSEGPRRHSCSFCSLQHLAWQAWLGTPFVESLILVPRCFSSSPSFSSYAWFQGLSYLRKMKTFSVAWRAYSFPLTALALASTQYALEVNGVMAHATMLMFQLDRTQG